MQERCSLVGAESLCGRGEQIASLSVATNYSNGHHLQNGDIFSVQLRYGASYLVEQTAAGQGCSQISWTLYRRSDGVVAASAANGVVVGGLCTALNQSFNLPNACPEVGVCGNGIR